MRTMVIEQEEKLSLVWKLAILTGLIWTIVIAGVLVWNIKNSIRHSKALTIYQARASFQQIVTARFWNATHGGVYVPVTERTKPNPYLDDPDRDKITADGLKLTKVNPAYMTRQMGEIAFNKNLVWFHITSSKPIRPQNAPESWELQALNLFASGAQEYSEFTEPGDGPKLFRYMAPLWVERPCLKCHAKQGYKENDLRGGISITIQADPIITLQNREIFNISSAFIVIWGLGLLGISVVSYRLTREEKRRESIIAQLQEALSEVKQLSGLLPICASCKNIRDDKGYWNQIESYIKERSEAEFSHGLCPDCAKKLYPNLYLDDDKKNT
jgi:hypothetical protein